MLQVRKLHFALQSAHEPINRLNISYKIATVHRTLWKAAEGDGFSRVREGGKRGLQAFTEAAKKTENNCRESERDATMT